MRARTPVVVLLAAAIGTVACRRGLARMAESAFAGGLSLAGYGPFPKRDPICPAGSSETASRRGGTEYDRAPQSARPAARTHQGRVRPVHRGRTEATAGARLPDRLGRRGLGSVRGGVSQRVAQGACPAPTRQARVRHCDRGEHRHPDRAVRISGRRAGDRPDRDPLSQPRRRTG
jgi:hypothetical protein